MKWPYYCSKCVKMYVFSIVSIFKALKVLFNLKITDKRIDKFFLFNHILYQESIQVFLS